jgi:hypothetical protein
MLSERFEQRARQELDLWKHKIGVKPSMAMRLSKQAQTAINQKIPQKVHDMISTSIKTMVDGVLYGSTYFKKVDQTGETLEEKEEIAQSILNVYRRTAVIEGAGTGAGGLLLGLSDFPLLLSIKIKYLFSIAELYGYDPKKWEERIFILLVFQLAFSSVEKRKELLSVMEDWDNQKESYMQIDWQSFQQEYRDSIDFIKMMQLVPGIGAIVGAWANHQLLEQLGETAKYAYRMRWFKQEDNR